MSGVKHTPLEVEDLGLPEYLDGIRSRFTVRSKSGAPIAYAFDADEARLIAAAPDLLEAVKPFATAIMHLGNGKPDETVIDLRMGGNHVFYQVTLGDFRRALNAIARARGEQDGGGS